ncbi:MAG: UbiA family prenyltransferase, partial [Thermoanaerobaculia bacterium]|nr:UbiA family prenyltransferase [Thermoanaerobaculia bacterium]
MDRSTASETDGRGRARLLDYLALARIGHWIKHLFIVPGIILAALLHRRPLDVGELWQPVLFGLVSASLVASANYVLNEWLDRASDSFHPRKSARPAVSKRLSPLLLGTQYVGLLGLGLLAATGVTTLFALTVSAFAVAAWIYNVPPLRTKDVVYLDVLSESVTTTHRLTMGWAMVDGRTLPPGSLMLAFWTAGAFLMAV